MNDTHSLLPWHIEELPATIRIRGAGDECVMESNQYRVHRKADTEFIVRACNSHDDLLAALKGSLDWLASYPGGNANAAYLVARAAVDKAEAQ